MCLFYLKFSFQKILGNKLYQYYCKSFSSLHFFYFFRLKPIWLFYIAVTREGKTQESRVRLRGELHGLARVVRHPQLVHFLVYFSLPAHLLRTYILSEKLVWRLWTTMVVNISGRVMYFQKVAFENYPYEVQSPMCECVGCRIGQMTLWHCCWIK